MLERNPYVVLAVERTESLQGIRAAYGDLAKRYHPDRVGEGGVASFREIAEAYRVLSDTALRRACDDALARSEGPRALVASGGEASPVPAEPSIPATTSLRRGSAEIRPSAEALLERLARNFSGHGVPKAERVEPLDLQLVLSRWEAAEGSGSTAEGGTAEGGIIVIGIPVFARCPACRGLGATLLSTCSVCDGEGIVEREGAVPIRIPRGVVDRVAMTASLDHLGVHNLCLRVRIRLAS